MSFLAHLFPAGWVGTSVSRWAVALVATILFTVVARVVHGVTFSGGAAGALICLCLFIAVGPIGVAMLGLVFALTWLCTLLGYRRKERLGTAEQRSGRSAAQVFANLGVSAVCALLYAANHSLFAVACTAALAEAAADTVSSEFGQASSNSARLITTGQVVGAGTNGAISTPGSIAGMSAAAIVAGLPLLTGFIPVAAFCLAISAAIAGMFFDSYLGAQFEQRGRLTNNAVNFLSTLVAATLGATVWPLFS